jgi:purine-binding chemotaxis protein CheW
MQIIVFNLGSEQYAIETKYINGIDKCFQVTEMPNVDTYIKGLANLRGNIISIMSLKKYLNIDDNTPEENTLIFVKDGEQIGLQVDKVKEVTNIDENAIETIDTPSEYMTGIINKNNNIITLIEGDALLS